MTRTRWKPNARFLIVFGVVCAAVCAGGYFWHAYQVRCNADGFLVRAQQRIEEQAWEEAAKNYDRYLRLVPDDVEVRVRLAETFDRAAHSLGDKRRATELYFKALAVVPERVDLRRRQAELLLEIGQAETDGLQRIARCEAALRQADEVLAASGLENDPGAWNVKAVAACELFQLGKRRFQLAEVVDLLHRAVKCNWASKEHVDLVRRLADLYRDDRGVIYRQAPSDPASPPGSPQREALTPAQRSEIADRLIDEMIEANADRAAAYLARYHYRESHGLPGAEEDLEQAETLSSNEDDPRLDALVQLTSAAHALRTGRLDEASERYRQFIETVPSEPRGYLGLARCLEVKHAADREGPNTLGEAVRVLREGRGKVGGDDFELNATLARLLIRSGELDEAAKVLATLQDSSSYRLDGTASGRARIDATIDLLRAEEALARGKHRQVLEFAQRILVREATASGSPHEAGETDLVCGRAYALQGSVFAHFGEWDRAAQAYSRAVGEAPGLVELHIQAAIACERAGQFDAAAQHYEQSATIAEDDPAVWVGLGRARLRGQLTSGRPPQWDGVEEALSRAKEMAQGGDAFQVKFLESQLALAKRQTAEALALVEQAEAAGPESVADWRGLVFAYQGLGQPGRADEALKQFAERSSDHVEPLLLKAELSARRGQGQFEVVREELNSALPALSPSDRNRVHALLAEQSLRSEKRQQARTHLEAAVEARPDDLDSTRRLCSMALAANDLQAAKIWEERLRQLGGPSSTDWRVMRAQRLLAQAETGGDPRLLEEVESLVREIEGMRPSWPPAFRLKGMLAERQGKPAEAVRAFQRAMELDRLGSARDFDLASILQLWDTQGAGPDAQDEVLPTVIANSRKGSMMAIARRVARGEIQLAVRDAQEAARQRPEDPTAQIWLGYTLWLAEKLDEAEKAFVRATELAPASPQAWNELLVFYSETEDRDQVRSLLTKVAGISDMPEPARSLLVARGWELLEDSATASRWYTQLEQRFPEDLAVLAQAGRFYQARDIDRAEALLRKAVEIAPGNRAVSRALADALASRGTEAALKEARELLSGGTTGAPIDPDDRRTLARILLGQGGAENRREAAKLLESLVNNAARPSHQDRRQLARIYEGEGKLDKAAEQYKALADRKYPRSEWIAEYAAFLLRAVDRGKQEYAPDAEAAVGRLERLEPGSLRTVSLKVRWLKQEGRTEEVRGEVERFVETQKAKTPADSATQAQLLAQAAGLYGSVDMADLAQQALREAAKIHPPARLWLAVFLAQRGSEEATLEAVNICLDAIKSEDSSQNAVTLCNVLSVGKTSAEADRIAEPVLAQLTTKHTDDAEFLLALGSLHQMRGENEEAEELFRRVLESNPANASALNNLAYLLAELGRGDEAQACIDRAIGLVGPVRWMLDTRGMVCLSRGEHEKAVRWFEELAGQPEPDPRYRFHLALAYRRAGKLNQARAEFKKAREGGLERHSLTPADQKNLQELDSLLTQGVLAAPEHPSFRLLTVP